MSIPHSRTVRKRNSGGADWRSVVGEGRYSYPTYRTAGLPQRLLAGVEMDSRPESLRLHDAQLDFPALRSPLQDLTKAREATEADTRRALLRLQAAWLVGEDHFGLLDVRQIEPLPHQLSLVEHVLASPKLTRVLIADEVGLGKTIEAALIVQRLLAARTPTSDPLRVLYLTEARLVDNVAEEFRRVGVAVRRWSTDVEEATLDPDRDEGVVIASMHRAVANARHQGKLEAAGPWDVLLVDEAHHLTDWSDNGLNGQSRMALVRKILAERMRGEKRLMLLTGTPHQGHGDRFQNLLRLLDESLKDAGRASGRVIYRIKEDIKGWDGEPLFPMRTVHAPTEVQMPPEYAQWLAQVGRLLTQSTTRAHAWRRTQALQWCASSPEAGLAFLVRLALRSGLKRTANGALTRALSSLRPYQNGPANEHLDDLEERMVKVRDEDPDATGLERARLEEVLELGIQLTENDAVGFKFRQLRRWIDAARGEKFVIFAQPLDTVYLLRRRLEAELGTGTVSLIVGGQTAETRKQEINRFRNERRTRALVSSRSGGEGINLQVSRNLVHFDVPWNPMELEQRVGRVHRYGGVGVVNVWTLLAAGSREERVLARCRARMGQIARDLDHDRFELHFARTLSMIPLEQLEGLMAAEDFGPLKPKEGERIDRLIQEGYADWKKYDGGFRQLAAALPVLQRGPVRDADLAAFLTHDGGFRSRPGWTSMPGGAGGPAAAGAKPVPVFELKDGSFATTSRLPQYSIVGPEGAPHPRTLGANDALVAEALRDAVLPEDQKTPFGTAAMTVPAAAMAAWIEGREWKHAVLCGYLVRKLDGTSLAETGTRMVCFLASTDGEAELELLPEVAANVIRVIRELPVQTRAVTGLNADLLVKREAVRIQALAAGSNGQMVAVFPIASIVLETDAARR